METMYPGQVNSPQTELASAITDTDTTIPLLDTSKLPAPPNIATIGVGEDAETILYTGVSGNDLTGVTRGFQGAAKAWAQGTKVARLFTEYDYDALRQNILSHASRHAAGGPDEITPASIGAASQADFAAHEADTTAHGIGDKSTLLTTNKNTIVEAINELFTNADNGKSSIATVIGSPATSGDTFSQLATHITNHKNALASSLGSGSGSDSLQTLVDTRLQGLKNTLAMNLTNKGQPSNGSETLQNLINKVASIATGKRFLTGSVTSSSTGENFSGVTTSPYRYSVVVNGLTFKPSIIFVYTGPNMEHGGSVTVYKSGGVIARGGTLYEIVEIVHFYDTANTSGEMYRTTTPAYVTSSGFKLPVNRPSQVYDWIAIE